MRTGQALTMMRVCTERHRDTAQVYGVLYSLYRIIRLACLIGGDQLLRPAKNNGDISKEYQSMIGQAGKNNANIYITGSKRWMGNLNTSTLQHNS